MPKLRSLRDAIAEEVEDGMSVFMGAALESLIPFAAGYELIRQRKRDLTLMTTISDMQFDQLIGAGCARRVCGAWVGNVAAGLGHNFRRAVERQEPGPLAVDNHSNFSIALGLKAAAMGVPFLPTRTLMGSDFREEDSFAGVVCPFTDEKLLAVRAVKPDVAILHVQRADEEGNAHVWGNLGVTQDAAMAAGKVVLTCEEIVPHEVILSDPNRTLVPGFLVAAVVRVPFGSHPAHPGLQPPRRRFLFRLSCPVPGPGRIRRLAEPVGAGGGRARRLHGAARGRAGGAPQARRGPHGGAGQLWVLVRHSKEPLAPVSYGKYPSTSLRYAQDAEGVSKDTVLLSVAERQRSEVEGPLNLSAEMASFDFAPLRSGRTEGVSKDTVRPERSGASAERSRRAIESRRRECYRE